MPHRYRNSRATWDHTVLLTTRQRWHSRLYPSRSWYSIKRTQRDARLSWLSWMITARDGIPARRRSPIPVVTGPDVRQLRSLTNSANHYNTSPTTGIWNPWHLAASSWLCIATFDFLHYTSGDSDVIVCHIYTSRFLVFFTAILWVKTLRNVCHSNVTMLCL